MEISVRSHPVNVSFQTEFARAGYLGPIRLFSTGECRKLLRAIRHAPPVAPADWFKGAAVSSRLYYEIASYGPIVDRVAALLGPDVMLWGASLVRRPPAAIHPWHTDIETSSDTGKSISVWLGLENTSRLSALQLVRGSHRFGLTIQQAACANDTSREDVQDDAVASWAHERDPQSALLRPDMVDGEAIFFDGRLWHSSNNKSRRLARTALLLQYATPDTPIRIPDLRFLEWPFRFLESPRPRCIMIRGTDRHGVNDTVAPPPIAHRNLLPPVPTKAHIIEPPSKVDSESGCQQDWRWRDIFRGGTSDLAELGCHVSVLAPGKTPHPPHEHREEELLIMLAGEAELILVDKSEQETRHRLSPGSFVYYPAGQRHTITNPAAADAIYLMFKWTGQHGIESNALETTVVRYLTGDDCSAGCETGFQTQNLLNGATDHLRRFHSHLTTVQPGAGYAPHVDAYDVAILTLEGTVETLGQIVAPHNVIFYAAGQPHGIKNIGSTPARYLVFEFHGSRARIDHGRHERFALKRLLRPVKSLAKRVWRRAA